MINSVNNNSSQPLAPKYNYVSIS
uniref:Uncharacterized protein n=1 Tax=Arundo donax TaxID=35708 RepID=A0A0A9DV76_ARUDO